MKSIFEAIYSHFKNDPLSAVLTDLYASEAPESAVFPYGIFSFPSDVADWTFTENFENILVQFSLYSSKSLEQLCTLFELLKGDKDAGTGFDFLDLPIAADYVTISMERVNAIPTKVEDVWQYSVTYRLYVQKI